MQRPGLSPALHFPATPHLAAPVMRAMPRAQRVVHGSAQRASMGRSRAKGLPQIDRILQVQGVWAASGTTGARNSVEGCVWVVSGAWVP